MIRRESKGKIVGKLYFRIVVDDLLDTKLFTIRDREPIVSLSCLVLFLLQRGEPEWELYIKGIGGGCHVVARPSARHHEHVQISLSPYLPYLLCLDDYQQL